MSVRVLAGSGDSGLAAHLRDQLAGSSGSVTVDTASTSSDVLSRVARNDVDAVLLDEEIGPLPALELVREIAMRHPYVAVVVLAGDADPDTVGRAMEAGARGLLSRRPSAEELGPRLRSAAEWTQSMRAHLGASPGSAFGGKNGRLVALCGAKGGTGTTTLAVQLALLAAEDRSVLLADMDLQAGDIPTYLDIMHRRTIADLVGVAGELTPQMLMDTLYLHPEGPHVLLSPADGERGEDVTSRISHNILAALRSRYELVIADCGSYMTEGNVTAVELADQVLLTVTPDLPSLRGAKRLCRLWERLGVRRSGEVSVVLTRHSKHNEIQPDFAARILGLPLLKSTVPAAFRALEKGVNSGESARVADDGFERAIVQLGTELRLTGADAAAGRETAG